MGKVEGKTGIVEVAGMEKNMRNKLFGE